MPSAVAADRLTLPVPGALGIDMPITTDANTVNAPSSGDEAVFAPGSHIAFSIRSMSSSEKPK